jgi:hypothetical protein
MGRAVTGKSLGTIVVKSNTIDRLADLLGIRKSKLQTGKLHLVKETAKRGKRKTKRKTKGRAKKTG